MKNLFVILLLLSVNTVFAQSDSLVLRSSADEMLNVNGRVLESNIPYSTSIFQEISKDEVVSFTTFTSEEIENLGFNNLYDLLNYIPGFQSFQNSSPYGVMPKIAVRGVSHEFNSSILFLLNGKRLNDSMFGSGTALMSYFDLRIVKRVEVIRGAGTLRFGDKAYIGLVNLITNTDQTNASVDLRAPLGVSSNINVSNNVSIFLRLDIAATYLETIGYEHNLDGKNTRAPINFWAASFRV
jgi:outer membrane cobalamin receptor